MPRSKIHMRLEELQEELIVIKKCLIDLKKYKLVGIVKAKQNVLESQKKDILKEMYRLEDKFLDD